METLPSGSSGPPVVAKNTVGRVRVAKYWASTAASAFGEAWALVVDNTPLAILVSAVSSVARPAWSSWRLWELKGTLPRMTEFFRDMVPGVVVVVGVFLVIWLSPNVQMRPLRNG